jgi:beta-glucanase (GH16 family)
MENTSFIRFMALLMIILVLCACEEDDPVDLSNPSNLVVEIIYLNDNNKTIIVQARADNAVEYQLRIGSDTEPVATNTNGNFEYTFLLPGNYKIDVRAFGSSGKYLKEEIAVNIVDDEPVTIEQGYSTPLEYDGYELVWNDEFDGNSLNTNNWVYEIGDGCPNLCGWGNNELQFYRSENAWVSDGVLTIEARNQSWANRSYTSARIKTQGKQSFQYGRIDIRALLPKGQGIWPALWMLGNSIQPLGWPACGEIDIMELVGGGPGKDNRVHGTLHWDNNGHVYTGGSYTLPSGIFANEYHVFTIIWDSLSIKWFVNDTKFHEIDITPTHMTEFHQKFFFIFNVAVGGIWPGNPDASTVFPQQMKVDYVRVFQRM